MFKHLHSEWRRRRRSEAEKRVCGSRCLFGLVCKHSWIYDLFCLAIYHEWIHTMPPKKNRGEKNVSCVFVRDQTVADQRLNFPITLRPIFSQHSIMCAVSSNFVYKRERQQKKHITTQDNTLWLRDYDRCSIVIHFCGWGSNNTENAHSKSIAIPFCLCSI